jgi:hypothetical protein
MTLQETHAEIANYAGEVCKLVCTLFRPGAKVTILVRNPGKGSQTYGPHGADLVVSDDDMDLVIESLRYLKEREERKLRP